jgi:hypothetical protein
MDLGGLLAFTEFLGVFIAAMIVGMLLLYAYTSVKTGGWHNLNDEPELDLDEEDE